MADSKISGLPPAGALTGAELLSGVQEITAVDTTVKILLSDIFEAVPFATLIPALNDATSPLTGVEKLMIIQDVAAVPTAVKIDIDTLLTGMIITDATTTRTLTATDNGKVLYFTSSSAITLTCAVSLGAGFNCTVIQGGTGKVTVAAGAASLVSFAGLYSTMGQYAIVSLISPVTNVFIAAGNLGA